MGAYALSDVDLGKPSCAPCRCRDRRRVRRIPLLTTRKSSSMDIAGVKPRHPCFISIVSFEGVVRSSILCCHQVTFGPWWSLRRRISWRPDWRTSNGGSSPCTVEELAWCSEFGSSMTVGAAPQVKFSENPRSGLNWLCMAMTLLQALFWERGLSLGWKPKIFDQATMEFVQCSHFKGVAFGEPEVQMLSWWWMYYCC
jgi:hypothetical protein